MSLEIGSVVEGVVTGITSFGAFVRLPAGNSGLIHISEVADAFVEDIRQYINEKDKVMVKVLGLNERGKYDLSLKQAEQPKISQEKEKEVVVEKPVFREEKRKLPEHREFSFEDKLSRYMKESEEKLLDLKRNTEAKRGRGKSR